MQPRTITEFQAQINQSPIIDSLVTLLQKNKEWIKAQLESTDEFKFNDAELEGTLNPMKVLNMIKDILCENDQIIYRYKREGIINKLQTYVKSVEEDKHSFNRKIKCLFNNHAPTKNIVEQLINNLKQHLPSYVVSNDSAFLTSEKPVQPAAPSFQSTHVSLFASIIDEEDVQEEYKVIDRLQNVTTLTPITVKEEEKQSVTNSDRITKRLAPSKQSNGVRTFLAALHSPVKKEEDGELQYKLQS